MCSEMIKQEYEKLEQGDVTGHLQSNFTKNKKKLTLPALVLPLPMISNLWLIIDNNVEEQTKNHVSADNSVYYESPTIHIIRKYL